MVLSIQSIFEDHRVNCSCDYGNFTAEWCSENPPIVGGQYDVEIDIADSPRLHAAGMGSAQPRINDTRNGVEFCVQIESIEEDPVLCFRLGDSLFLFALDEQERANADQFKEKQWITFVSTHVQMYNTDILKG